MAEIASILDKEKKRAIPESLSEIYLWQGGTFYRAYGWSAFLCIRYVDSSLTVTKRFIKKIKGEIIFVGFPVDSLKKYTPEKATVSDFDQINKIITLPAGLVKPDNGSTFEKDYQNWYSTVQLQENKNETDTGAKDSTGHARPQSITGIMKELLEYPLLQSSPLSTMEFVADLQQRLSKIL